MNVFVILLGNKTTHAFNCRFPTSARTHPSVSRPSIDVFLTLLYLEHVGVFRGGAASAQFPTNYYWSRWSEFHLNCRASIGENRNRGLTDPLIAFLLITSALSLGVVVQRRRKWSPSSRRVTRFEVSLLNSYPYGFLVLITIANHFISH